MEKFFYQEGKGKIEKFNSIEKEYILSRIVLKNNNKTIKLGDDLVYGFMLNSETFIFNTKYEVSCFIIDNEKKIRNRPFLYLSCAEFCENISMLRRAMRNQKIINSFERGEISLSPRIDALVKMKNLDNIMKTDNRKFLFSSLEEILNKKNFYYEKNQNTVSNVKMFRSNNLNKISKNRISELALRVFKKME